jgi:para-nitrobenzyl esterase
MSVGCLLSAPAARGLFRRAIAQSGAAHHYATPDQATRAAAAFVRALGITGSQAERLWQVPVDEIVAAQLHCAAEIIERGPAGKKMVQMEITLIPVADGEVLPQEPLEAIAAGAAGDVPLLVGTNLDEWNFFIFLTDPRKQTLNDAALVKVIEKRLPGHGPRAAAYYRGALDRERKHEPWEIFGAFESDRAFRIPAIRLAEMQSLHQERTFMYLFDWRSPLAEGRMGSCHAIDLPFVFGDVDGEFGRLFTGGGPAARSLSEKMMDAWIHFARHGDPGHDAVGPWPRYDAGRRATMVLADRCRVREAPMDAQRAFWDELT